LKSSRSGARAVAFVSVWQPALPQRGLSSTSAPLRATVSRSFSTRDQSTFVELSAFAVPTVSVATTVAKSAVAMVELFPILFDSYRPRVRLSRIRV